jgi:hypothetical protein
MLIYGIGIFYTVLLVAIFTTGLRGMRPSQSSDKIPSCYYSVTSVVLAIAGAVITVVLLYFVEAIK